MDGANDESGAQGHGLEHVLRHVVRRFRSDQEAKVGIAQDVWMTAVRKP